MLVVFEANILRNFLDVCQRTPSGNNRPTTIRETRVFEACNRLIAQLQSAIGDANARAITNNKTKKKLTLGVRRFVAEPTKKLMICEMPRRRALATPLAIVALSNVAPRYSAIKIVE